MSDRSNVIGRRITAARRAGGASLLLAALAVLIPLLGPRGVVALQYDRTAIFSGEIYRIVTGHWTHWSGEHLAWDVATFLLLGIACERRGRWKMLATLCLAAVIVPAGLLLFQADLQIYRGLSALDSALFALLCVDVALDRARQHEWRWVIIAATFIIGFFIKTWIEFSSGAAVFVDAGGADFVPVPLAHLIGAAAGAGVALTRTSTTASSPDSSPDVSPRRTSPAA